MGWRWTSRKLNFLSLEAAGKILNLWWLMTWLKALDFLGSPFTSDGCTSSAVRAHAKANLCHALKYVSFVTKNNYFLFIIKKLILVVCLMSALLYGCESWLCSDHKPILKLNNWCLKQLLWVRRTTSNDVCYLEPGYPPLQDLVTGKQHRFFRKIWQERSELWDDPLSFTFKPVTEENTVTARLVRYFILNEVNDLCSAMQMVEAGIWDSTSFRRQTSIFIDNKSILWWAQCVKRWAQHQWMS